MIVEERLLDKIDILEKENRELRELCAKKDLCIAVDRASRSVVQLERDLPSHRKRGREYKYPFV